uniref:Cytochrome-c peroxidase n=1 Tax=Magnetococcus massalia (strain MO-1) TaxID=451514 RepID=A0A1S7LCV6_MAGMO|nr:Cytochrome-c peroxidase [Candidatus Magnetococcus massalia]
MRALLFLLLWIIPATLFVPAAQGEQALLFSPRLAAPRGEALQPISPATGLDPELVQLGHDLFHDTRLSRDDTISCAHCHPLESGGMDGLKHSFGIEGKEGVINTPTVYNTSLHFTQFWDGRAKDLETQAVGPIHDPREMGSSWQEVLPKLNADNALKQRFIRIMGGQASVERVVGAIATFERSLLTPSRFDRYLQGVEGQLTPQELRGYKLFKDYGCASCHQGRGIGGNMYEKIGIVHPYFTSDKRVKKADLGRFNITGNPDHKHEFKVPSLRNVALTAPYFHNGAVKTLEGAIKLMGYHQLGRTIRPTHIADIATFLHSLTGEHPELAKEATP